jgi:putative transposase
MRLIVEAMFYVLRAGCAWDMLSREFPPLSTVYRWFAQFRDNGTWETINHYLVVRDRERERVGRAASPTAGVLDSQSAKTAEAGGPRGYDAGKKVKGRKRHALVDTDGRALKLQVRPADVQDRDGAIPLLRSSRRSFLFLERVFADSGYAGERVASATRITVEIVRKAIGQVGFSVHKRRWVVERFFAWLGRNRRFHRNGERLISSAEAFLNAASAIILIRRIGRCLSDSERTLIVGPRSFWGLAKSSQHQAN